MIKGVFLGVVVVLYTYGVGSLDVGWVVLWELLIHFIDRNIAIKLGGRYKHNIIPSYTSMMCDQKQAY